ncbi:hypothetical protein [Rhizobium sp. L1K21]|uniref:hypothetical protein n=1 Tax=Rhizobium sp. L1K21 TaxID=2954933 RepID=UPI0020938520|nr:hypothetical protein [Rhizobium sp. L1K21]MCO6187670.1 hypothetical protein [Rhizobium sp. L1K21]
MLKRLDGIEPGMLEVTGGRRFAAARLVLLAKTDLSSLLKKDRQQPVFGCVGDGSLRKHMQTAAYQSLLK